MIKRRPPSPASSPKAPTKADLELVHRIFGKARLTLRKGVLQELMVDGQALDISGSADIQLQGKIGFEPKVNGLVEYTFALSQPTDLAWRSIFLDLFERPQIIFADSRIKVTCPPEDIAKVLPRMVATAATTNQRYAGIWEAVKQLAREQDQRRDEDDVREAERNWLIQKSFDQLEMPLAPVLPESVKNSEEAEKPAAQSWAPAEEGG